MVDEATALSGDGIDPTIDAPIGRTDNAETPEQVAERVATLLQEVAASGKSTVLVSHGDGAYYEAAFTIQIIDENDAPTAIYLNPSSVAENQSPVLL